MPRSRFDRVRNYIEASSLARQALFDSNNTALDTFDREVALRVARELEFESEPPKPKYKVGDRVTWEAYGTAGTVVGGKVVATIGGFPCGVELDAPFEDRVIDPRVRPEGLRLADPVTPETDTNGDRGSGKGWMGTSTGKKFWPLAPHSEDVDVRDIARGLAMTCRYGGQVKRYYSVAEHCVLVSRHVAPELALKALFHDCAEAYVGDMIRPLKHQAEMKAFRDAEAKIEAAVFEALGLVMTPEEHVAIKAIDDRILIDEICALSARPDYYLSTPLLKDKQALGVSIGGWSPADAERAFMLRYCELTSQAHRFTSYGGLCANSACSRRAGDAPAPCPSDGDPL